MIEPSSALTIYNRYIGSILLETISMTTDNLPTKKVLSPTDLFYVEILQTTKQFVIFRSKKTKISVMTENILSLNSPTES